MCDTKLVASSAGYGTKAVMIVGKDLDDAYDKRLRSPIQSDDTTRMTQSTEFGSPSLSERWSSLDSQDASESDHGNDYDAFLREMAGSFEASYDTDDDDEDEESGQIDGNDSTSEAVQDPKSIDYDAFLREMAGSYEAAPDDDDSESDSDGEGSSGLQIAMRGASSKDTPTCTRHTPVEGAAAGEQSSSAPVPPSPTWQGGVVVQLPNGALKHMDNRQPVEDSYEMVAAAQPLEPPELELPASFENQRIDLEHEIKLRKDQSIALFAMSRKKHVDEALCAHYGRVGMEIVTEQRSLEKKLEQLIEGNTD